jgi:predicted NUDIX family phosphoesterase
MANAYLEIAEKAIRKEGRPLHPKEILRVARENGLMPQHLFGKTPYKTMAARLSTDIRDSKAKSIFFRTASNRFFLLEMRGKEQVEFKAPRRQKTLHNENILTIDAKFLENFARVGVSPDPLALIREAYNRGMLKYLVRKGAERQYEAKQIISYALIHNNGNLLTYRRGRFNSAADEIQGMRSVGFGGHVADTDRDLFDQSGFGIIANARRELVEELVFDSRELVRLNDPSTIEVLCLINTNETDEARKHIAATVIYHCSSEFDPVKNEMSITDLRWTSLNSPENNLDNFEPWSQMLLRALYSGELKIGS